MFAGCSNLVSVGFSNVNCRNLNVKNMFSGCSEELKNKIRKHNKFIGEEAFQDIDDDNYEIMYHRNCNNDKYGDICYKKKYG